MLICISISRKGQRLGPPRIIDDSPNDVAFDIALKALAKEYADKIIAGHILEQKTRDINSENQLPLLGKKEVFIDNCHEQFSAN